MNRNETSPDVLATSKEENNDQDYITGQSRESDTDVHIRENDPSASSPEDQNLVSDHELEDDDELADSGDDSEAGGASLTQSPLSRRKLKMVLDVDDEDD